MKLKEGFIMRDVAGHTVVLPTGDDLNMNMMITLNDTGKFLWSHLQNEVTRDELIAAILGEYEVQEPVAAAAVDGFVARLKEYAFLAE